MANVTIQYKTDIERDTILADPPEGLSLIAELKHYDGNFLVFGQPEVSQPSTEERLKALEDFANYQLGL
jgi:hypothetical protein